MTRHNLLLAACMLLWQPSAGSVCIHESVQPDVVIRARLNYTSRADVLQSRQRRDATSLFQPIRVHTEYSSLDTELTSTEENVLRTIVRETLSKVADIFSVLPVSGNLLLQRSESACLSKWVDGPNLGRCASLFPGYTGETCLDNFQIPSEHLSGLYVWNYSHPEPQTVVSPGEGVPDSDYILYIRARSTSSCLQTGVSVIAYAAYCQVDQNSRPLAGYINFCPTWLRSFGDDLDKIAITALHEIFHALGFTKDLWSQFKDCSNTDPGDICPVYNNPIRDVLGQQCLITPVVMETASAYFSCHAEEFGPALEKRGDAAGSHWDETMMFGSIMTARIGLAEVTRVDAMTLAVFADSGWYQVNVQAAEDLVWGRDAGCDFGLPENCDSQYFCEIGSHGCHHLYLHKGICEASDQMSTCGMITATEQGSCQSGQSSSSSQLVEESYGMDGRCFLSNLTDTVVDTNLSLMGGCFEHRCLGDILQVRVVGQDWITCPYGMLVEIGALFGVLKCPPEGVLCVALPSTTTVPVVPSTRPAFTSTSTEPEMESLRLVLVFGEALYADLVGDSLLNGFTEQVLLRITEITSLNRSQVYDVHVQAGSVLVFFTVAAYLNSGPRAVMVFEQIQESVNAGNFTVILMDPSCTHTYTASLVRLAGEQNEDTDDIIASSSLSSGVIAAIVLVAIVTVAVISIALFILRRRWMPGSRVANSSQTYTSSGNKII